MRPTFLFFAVLLTGCATQPLPQFQYSDSSAFLLTNFLEKEMTHTYLGVTIFQNHSKRYEVDWDIPTRISSRMTAKLGDRLRIIHAPKWLAEVEGDLVKTGWDNFYLDDAYKPYVLALCKQHKAAGLIVVRSYAATRWIMGADRYIEGYGIYSQRALGNNPALVYTNFGAQLMNCDPPAFTIGSGVPELPPLPDYIEPDDSAQLPDSEIEKARPLVEAAADRVVDQLVEKIKAQSR
jgi:hypothetical protein